MKIEFGETYHPEFSGYVWEINEGIYLSFIESKNKGKGNFSRYLEELKAKYDFIKIPTPFGLMKLICLKKGFMEEKGWFPEAKEYCEIMVWKK